MRLSEIHTNPNNPRLIKDERFKKLVKSISEFPKMMELRPIIIDSEGTILGGNMRFKALCELKYKDIPDEWVKRADELTDEEKRRFIIEDNIGFGEWDWDTLANEWNQDELIEWGLEIPNFDNTPEAIEDDYEIPETIKTDIVLGDLFEIGNHRLLCGDATDSDQVVKLMGGALADMYITDPPYGVSYTGKTKDALKIQNDAMSKDGTHELWRDAFDTALTLLKDGASIYATVPAGLLQLGFMQVMVDADCLHQCMVWNKGQMVLGHSDYHYQHEPILYGWKPGKSHYFTKDRTKTTVFDFQKPMRNAEHPTMKPVELWSEMIHNSSSTYDICYDSFLGSGTTMVASHQLNRKCYGMELDPKYCQVIIDRMLKLDPSIVIKKNGKLI
jgi:site-specific DNA-methyltransferase (adenine-specific)